MLTYIHDGKCASAYFERRVENQDKDSREVFTFLTHPVTLASWLLAGKEQELEPK